MKNPNKLLTDRQLFRKVMREIRTFQQAELQHMKEVLKASINNDDLPLNWRKMDDKQLKAYVINKVQINWNPVDPELKAIYKKLDGLN